MSSCIFVDPNERVEVQVFFAMKNGKVQILEREEEDCQSLSVKFRRPDFATSQQIVSANSTIGPNGDHLVNWTQLNNSLLYILAAEWDAKDEKGNPIPLNESNVSKLRVEVARAVILRFIDKAGAIL